MKRSLHLSFTLLLLVAFLTLLTCRSALRHGFGSEFYAPVNNPLLNSTLISLASFDLNDSTLQKEVDDLLEGNLPGTAAARAAGAHRAISLWRQENHNHIGLRPATRFPIRLRSPKDYRIFPEFRRALRDWIRNRRYDPQVMSDLLRLVKDPIDRHFARPESDTSATRPYDTCAVVGNSGILLKSDYGGLIDGHDLVIRLNNARTQGYARHVGSKTNLSFVNSNILHLCARRQGCFCHPYGEDVPIIMYICQPVHFLDYTTCNSSHKSPLLITDSGFDVLCARIVKYYSLKRFVEETGKAPEEWGKSHDEKMFHYSSGMQAVVLASGICRKVSVFGFGKSTEAKHHYHTNQKVELDLHDYEAEYAFYRDLVERPQVIPFLKDSGFKVPPVVFYH